MIDISIELKIIRYDQYNYHAIYVIAESGLKRYSDLRIIIDGFLSAHERNELLNM